MARLVAVLRSASSVVRGPQRRAFAIALLGARSRNLVGGGAGDADLEDHLEATYGWLCRAQDTGEDDGVSWAYDVRTGGWAPSYPETTGYIISSFLALADATGDHEPRERARRMADWESQVQMPDGAVLSGVIGEAAGPAVFNTGQALFGWIAALELPGAARYEASARAAANWLLANQDTDGAWRANLSVLTKCSSPSYNCRCAWALAYAASVLGEERLLVAARRQCDWVLEHQNEAGWFAHAGFRDGQIPLLHTISYVIEGLVGVYAFTGEGRYLQAAQRALDPIVELCAAGRLAGRLDSCWRGTVPWRCPSGDAQIAVLLLRLKDHCARPDYAATAQRLIHELANMQRRLTRAQSAEMAGGLPGSFPIWGSYMRFQLPNWAAKFYLDALLLSVHGVDEKGFPGLKPNGATRLPPDPLAATAASRRPPRAGDGPGAPAVS